MSERVYVYGTLKKGHCNHQVMEMAGGVLVDDTVRLDGFRMTTLFGAYPGVEYTSNPDDWIQCELYEVQDLSVLDSLEGYYPEHPEHGLYNRIMYNNAWIYIYNDELTGEQINVW